MALTAVGIGYNCAAECRCETTFYEGEVCPRNQECSQMIPPLKTDFLLGLVGALLVAVSDLQSNCFK